jgi:hypothetical protein
VVHYVHAGSSPVLGTKKWRKPLFFCPRLDEKFIPKKRSEFRKVQSWAHHNTKATFFLSKTGFRRSEANFGKSSFGHIIIRKPLFFVQDWIPKKRSEFRKIQSWAHHNTKATFFCPRLDSEEAKRISENPVLGTS